MKAVARLLMRHEARVREAEALKPLRRPPGLLLPAHGPSTGLQLPLSLAPYRLQAADRWRQQSEAPLPRKRR